MVMSPLYSDFQRITSENRPLDTATNQEKHPSAVLKQSIEGMLQELLEISVAENKSLEFNPEALPSWRITHAEGGCKYPIVRVRLLLHSTRQPFMVRWQRRESL